MVVPDDFGAFIGGAVVELHVNPVIHLAGILIVHHMAVGDDVAVGSPDDAAGGAGLHELVPIIRAGRVHVDDHGGIQVFLHDRPGAQPFGFIRVGDVKRGGVLVHVPGGVGHGAAGRIVADRQLVVAQSHGQQDGEGDDQGRAGDAEGSDGDRRALFLLRLLRRLAGGRRAGGGVRRLLPAVGIAPLRRIAARRGCCAAARPGAVGLVGRHRAGGMDAVAVGYVVRRRRPVSGRRAVRAVGGAVPGGGRDYGRGGGGPARRGRLFRRRGIAVFRGRIRGFVFVFIKPIGHIESILSADIVFSFGFIFILTAVCVHLLKKKTENPEQFFIRLLKRSAFAGLRVGQPEFELGIAALRRTDHDLPMMEVDDGFDDIQPQPHPVFIE